VEETMKRSVGLAARAALGVLFCSLTGLFGGCSSVASGLPLAPRTAAAQDYSYIVGSGDSLNIIVWRNPELSMNVPVRPDGKITTPLIDELVVQGKTPAEIGRDIEKRLGDYVRDPKVSVVVTSFVGPYSQQIRVIGEAAKPQFLPFKQQMTLLDVMIAVGGLTDFAAGNDATIVRASEHAQYAVRLKDLIKRGDISANVDMKPGDVLIIPQSFF
jgi:polysaccharide export outer membrane protein